MITHIEVLHCPRCADKQEGNETVGVTVQCFIHENQLCVYSSAMCSKCDWKSHVNAPVLLGGGDAKMEAGHYYTVEDPKDITKDHKFIRKQAVDNSFGPMPACEGPGDMIRQILGGKEHVSFKNHLAHDDLPIDLTARRLAIRDRITGQEKIRDFKLNTAGPTEEEMEKIGIQYGEDIVLMPNQLTDHFSLVAYWNDPEFDHVSDEQMILDSKDLGYVSDSVVYAAVQNAQMHYTLARIPVLLYVIRTRFENGRPIEITKQLVSFKSWEEYMNERREQWSSEINSIRLNIERESAISAWNGSVATEAWNGSEGTQEEVQEQLAPQNTDPGPKISGIHPGDIGPHQTQGPAGQWDEEGIWHQG